MTLYTAHLTPSEKEAMTRILLKRGDLLRDALEHYSKEHTIKQIADANAGTPLLCNLNANCLQWFFEAIKRHGPVRVLEKLSKAPSTKLCPVPQPEGLDNVYDWFVETHSIQITQILRDGGSIRSIVRDFNEAYSPDSNEDHGLRPIRLRIKKLGILSSTPKNWLADYPDLQEKIKNQQGASELYPLAQAYGYTKSLRTFQREVKKIRAHQQAQMLSLKLWIL